jgi:catechol 2,3-dioxygenase-like lactoylglutathione lyase family enzyme
MSANSKAEGNVKEVVPFFGVVNMERSLRYYVEGLGFTMERKWVVDGKVRWCWLALGGAALMLQEFSKRRLDSGVAERKLGEGVSLCFQCQDALAIYREVKSRGVEASEPQVGNALWVTGLTDPDGYRLEFASPTDTPEETKLSEVKGGEELPSQHS